MFLCQIQSFSLPNSHVMKDMIVVMGKDIEHDLREKIPGIYRS